MKKVLSIAAVALMLFACNSMSSPKQTVSTFIGAMKAKNYDQAVNCCTEKSGQTFRSFIGLASQERLDELLRLNSVIVSDSIDPSGQKAWVHTRPEDNSSGIGDTFTLVKEDEKWKILIEKTK